MKLPFLNYFTKKSCLNFESIPKPLFQTPFQQPYFKKNRRQINFQKSKARFDSTATVPKMTTYFFSNPFRRSYKSVQKTKALFLTVRSYPRFEKHFFLCSTLLPFTPKSQTCFSAACDREEQVGRKAAKKSGKAKEVAKQRKSQTCSSVACGREEQVGRKAAKLCIKGKAAGSRKLAFTQFATGKNKLVARRQNFAFYAQLREVAKQGPKESKTACSVFLWSTLLSNRKTKENIKTGKLPNRKFYLKINSFKPNFGFNFVSRHVFFPKLSQTLLPFVPKLQPSSSRAQAAEEEGCNFKATKLCILCKAAGSLKAKRTILFLGGPFYLNSPWKTVKVRESIQVSNKRDNSSENLKFENKKNQSFKTQGKSSWQRSILILYYLLDAYTQTFRIKLHSSFQGSSHLQVLLAATPFLAAFIQIYLNKSDLNGFENTFFQKNLPGFCNPTLKMTWETFVYTNYKQKLNLATLGSTLLQTNNPLPLLPPLATAKSQLVSRRQEEVANLLFPVASGGEKNSQSESHKKRVEISCSPDTNSNYEKSFYGISNQSSEEAGFFISLNRNWDFQQKQLSTARFLAPNSYPQPYFLTSRYFYQLLSDTEKQAFQKKLRENFFLLPSANTQGNSIEQTHRWQFFWNELDDIPTKVNSVFSNPSDLTGFQNQIQSTLFQKLSSKSQTSENALTPSNQDVSPFFFILPERGNGRENSQFSKTTTLLNLKKKLSSKEDLPAWISKPHVQKRMLTPFKNVNFTKAPFFFKEGNQPFQFEFSKLLGISQIKNQSPGLSFKVPKELSSNLQDASYRYHENSLIVSYLNPQKSPVMWTNFLESLLIRELKKKEFYSQRNYHYTLGLGLNRFQEIIQKKILLPAFSANSKNLAFQKEGAEGSKYMKMALRSDLKAHLPIWVNVLRKDPNIFQNPSFRFDLLHVPRFEKILVKLILKDPVIDFTHTQHFESFFEFFKPSLPSAYSKTDSKLSGFQKDWNWKTRISTKSPALFSSLKKQNPLFVQRKVSGYLYPDIQQRELLNNPKSLQLYLQKSDNLKKILSKTENYNQKLLTLSSQSFFCKIVGKELSENFTKERFSWKKDIPLWSPLLPFAPESQTYSSPACEREKLVGSKAEKGSRKLAFSQLATGKSKGVASRQEEVAKQRSKDYSLDLKSQAASSRRCKSSFIQVYPPLIFPNLEESTRLLNFHPFWNLIQPESPLTVRKTYFWGMPQKKNFYQFAPFYQVGRNNQKVSKGGELSLTKYLSPYHQDSLNLLLKAKQKLVKVSKMDSPFIFKEISKEFTFSNYSPKNKLEQHGFSLFPFQKATLLEESPAIAYKSIRSYTKFKNQKKLSERTFSSFLGNRQDIHFAPKSQSSGPKVAKQRQESQQRVGISKFLKQSTSATILYEPIRVKTWTILSQGGFLFILFKLFEIIQKEYTAEISAYIDEFYDFLSDYEKDLFEILIPEENLRIIRNQNFKFKDFVGGRFLLTEFGEAIVLLRNSQKNFSKFSISKPKALILDSSSFLVGPGFATSPSFAFYAKFCRSLQLPEALHFMQSFAALKLQPSSSRSQAAEEQVYDSGAKGSKGEQGENSPFFNRIFPFSTFLSPKLKWLPRFRQFEKSIQQIKNPFAFQLDRKYPPESTLGKKHPLRRLRFWSKGNLSFQFSRTRLPKKTNLKWNSFISKGILLVGPPGNGKTLFVKALAGETKVPIIVESGKTLSTNQETSGTERLSHLFQAAQKMSPCILFFDEIDRLGQKRENVLSTSMVPQIQSQIPNTLKGLYLKNEKTSASVSTFGVGDSGTSFFSPFLNGFQEELFNPLLQLQSNSKNRTTQSQKKKDLKIQQTDQQKLIGEKKTRNLELLTQLLYEFDGLTPTYEIQIIGATNRPATLDSALTRPGRFGKILYLDLPGKQKRFELFRFYAKAQKDALLLAESHTPEFGWLFFLNSLIRKSLIRPSFTRSFRLGRACFKFGGALPFLKNLGPSVSSSSFQIKKAPSRFVEVDTKLDWNYFANQTAGLSSAHLATAMNRSALKAIFNYLSKSEEKTPTLGSLQWAFAIPAYNVERNILGGISWSKNWFLNQDILKRPSNKFRRFFAKSKISPPFLKPSVKSFGELPKNLKLKLLNRAPWENPLGFSNFDLTFRQGLFSKNKNNLPFPNFETVEYGVQTILTTTARPEIKFGKSKAFTQRVMGPAIMDDLVAKKRAFTGRFCKKRKIFYEKHHRYLRILALLKNSIPQKKNVSLTAQIEFAQKQENTPNFSRHLPAKAGLFKLTQKLSRKRAGGGSMDRQTFLKSKPLTETAAPISYGGPFIFSTRAYEERRLQLWEEYFEASFLKLKIVERYINRIIRNYSFGWVALAHSTCLVRNPFFLFSIQIQTQKTFRSLYSTLLGFQPQNLEYAPQTFLNWKPLNEKTQKSFFGDSLFINRSAYYLSGKVVAQFSNRQEKPNESSIHLWSFLGDSQIRQKSLAIEKTFLNKSQGESLLISLIAGKAMETLMLRTPFVKQKKENASNIGFEELQKLSFLLPVMNAEYWFSSSKSLTRKQININLVENQKELNKEAFLFLKELASFFESQKATLATSNLQLGIKLGNGSSQSLPPFVDLEQPWWQFESLNLLASSNFKYGQWYRLFVAEEQQNFRNIEWVEPDNFFHNPPSHFTNFSNQNGFKNLKGTQNQKDVLAKYNQFAKLNWNQIQLQKTDLQMSYAVFESFNTVLTLFENNRELVDFYVYALICKEKLRPFEIVSIHKRFFK